MENWGGYTPILDVSVPPPQFPTDCVALSPRGAAPPATPFARERAGDWEKKQAHSFPS